MKIELQRIATGFQGEFCYTHARAAAAPFPATRNGRSRWRTPRRFTMPPPENSC